MLPVLPIFAPPAHLPALWLARVEQESRACLQLLLLLTERLQRVLGPEGLGPDVAAVLAATNPDQLRATAAHIDATIRDKSKGQAARILRETFATTWDDAHQLVAYWKQVPLQQRLQWLRATQLQKALSAIGSMNSQTASSTQQGLQ